MNKLQSAEQFRRALQMFATTLTEEQALEVPCMYDTWEIGKLYTVGDYITYGVNGVGDPQLYRVAQAHTSQEDWTPNKVPSIYVPIGLDDSGYPVWAAPTGAHDAYNTGDVVNYNGTLYESLIDGNTTVPSSDERYWRVYSK
jgi:hypothetical protein